VMKINLVILLSLLSISNGYKILFLVPFPGPSHWFLLQSFVKELVNRGHHVTAIVNKPITAFKSPNYTEVLINPSFDITTVFSYTDIYDSPEDSNFEKVRAYERICTPSSEHGLNNSNVQKIIHSQDLHFDLVINEEMFHESWLMFAYKFNTPIVTISTYGYSDFFDSAMGLLTPISHVPHMLLPYGDDMTYFQRVFNVILTVYDWLFRTWVTIPIQNEIAQRYFGHLAKPGQPLPKVEELYRNISLVLVNSHRSTSKPRPQMPGIVYMGGIHITPAKPLPATIQEFIDNSEHGVILFSLGSLLQSSQLPEAKIQLFLKVFGQLKQRVIWKYEDESLKVPPNVLIKKWLPQSDILAQPNVVLFITHGGMSGTFEGTARGVPMLFIPFFGDQKRNALKSVSNGNGLLISLYSISEESLSAVLDEMVSNDKYNNRAKELARNFNDNLVHPMDEAMFWIEYVIRSNGAKHLKSSAVNMSLFSYLLLDILVLPIAVIWIVYLLVRLLLCAKKLKSNQEKGATKKKKTQ
ncbi:hypothetical protein HA402_015641, partial [Bradysia odoriphaga]